MIRSAGYLGLDPAEPEFGKIEFVDKNVDDANRLVLTDPVFQAFGKQCALTAIRPFDEPPFSGERMLDNGVEVVELRRPAALRAQPLAVGDDRRWTAGAAGFPPQNLAQSPA